MEDVVALMELSLHGSYSYDEAVVFKAIDDSNRELWTYLIECKDES